MKLPISKKAKEVLNTLTKNGYKAYIVGGSVRDLLMHKKPHDYDIATSATPDEIKACFPNHKQILVGKRFGTISIIYQGSQFEITTFRTEDNYCDNRHPEDVVFTDDIALDLARRDFTINALAYNNEDGIIDIFDGATHIKSKTICCVGNADTRFREDALRILRAVRFASTLGFSIDTDTKTAIYKNAHLLKNISAERKRDELCKMIMGNNIYAVLVEYADILSEIIPELQNCIGYDLKRKTHHLTLLEHLAKSVDVAPHDLDIRLTLLFHDISKPLCKTIDSEGNPHFRGHNKLSAKIAEECLTSLCFSKKRIAHIKELIIHHDNPIPKTECEVRRYLKMLGADNLRDLLRVKTADIKAHAKTSHHQLLDIKLAKQLLRKTLSRGDCYTLSMLAINGDDLLAENIVSNKQIGEVLNRLLNLVIENPEQNQKEILLEIARNMH
ncbi:MAG: hypothetical protein IJC83_05460 [Oscillospiraceae bacterium]|nr:hypothetical protein [Oscillospiraceae bacterium]